MPTNYNQLLKDLEIGSVYIKIFICFLGCTFMLYPVLFYFTHFFRELSVYEQIFFVLGSSALYTGLGVPLCHKISGSILSSFNATVSFGNSNYLHSLLYGQEL